MVYELEGIQAGVITFAGTYQTVSETQANYTYRLAGYFTGGPLAGANLLAIGQIEETRDSNGDVVTSPGTVEGVLIVPFYTDFPPFKDMESLPPLKSVTELPSGIGWRICEVEQPKRLVDFWPQDDDHVYGLWDTILSCADLDLHDLWLPELYHGYGPLPVGGRYGTTEFLPLSGVNEVGEWPKLPPANTSELIDTGKIPCGETAWQGMLGRSESGSRYVYEDYTGVFWKGPMAGCLYLSSTSFRAGSGSNLDEVSTVLLIPDETDHGIRAPQKFLNVSERGMVGTGDDVLITGFVVSGESPRTVLVRAIGPGLAQFGVTDYLTDPVLKVFRDGVEVGSNENWGESLNREVIAEMSQKAGAFALESDSNDAAILFSWLEPGAYTVHVSGAEGTSGVALAEVYQIGD
jgi:hypothetical protein